jgi:type III secretion protein T
VIAAIVPAVSQPLVDAVPWLDQMLLIAVSSARFAFSFLFVPVFSKEAMPATVRNSIIITLGLVALQMAPDFKMNELSAGAWTLMLLKEAAAGTIIGLFFGTILWAMTAAGEIIDTKVGATIAQVMDPMTGQQTSLNGILFGRFAQVIFVTMGGFTLLVGAVMQSYAVWPIGPGALILEPGSIMLYEGEFGRLMTWAFALSVPVLTMLYIIDLGMGFLNRFAQQFNVFSLSMPIKSVAATLVIIVILPGMAQVIIGDLASRTDVAEALLSQTAKPAPRDPAANATDGHAAEIDLPQTPLSDEEGMR